MLFPAITLDHQLDLYCLLETDNSKMMLGNVNSTRPITRQCMTLPGRLSVSGPAVQPPNCVALKQAARADCVGRGRLVSCNVAAADQAGTIEALSAPANQMPPFHLAFPVHSIDAARDFYGGKLGCPEGRSAKTWVDYSLYGHQIVCHHVVGYKAASSANAVDGDAVPVPHFGLALSVSQFHELARRVQDSGITFIIEPHLRFEGQPGEQYTMFFQDASGNSLEFKAMTKPENLFAKYTVTS